MKESVANSYILTLIVIFIALIISTFLSYLNYSKAFKTKTKVIDIIESYDAGYSSSNRSEINGKIEAYLKQAGYRVNSSNDACPIITKSDGSKSEALNTVENYKYCIYEENNGRGSMYKVLVYMYFDVPLMDFLEFPLTGQTEVFYFVVDTNN
jgi:hypothetical protein